MDKIIWDFIIPLLDEKAIKRFEIKNAFQLPSDLKQCIEKNNAGMPDKETFDTEMAKGRVIKGLLSFNEGDEESIYDFIDFFKENGEIKMFPFALDPFGNLICLKNGKVVLWLHETKKIEFVASNFTEFLNKLY